MDKIKKGLGRGLSSLIGESKVESRANQLQISDLIPNKYQPRKIFDENNLAGLNEVPVVVTKADDLKSLEFAIVENVQRHDLNPLEEAQGYKRLIDEFSYDQEKVAKFIGKSRSHIANCLRLLTLPNEVIELIEAQKLTAGHAKILVGLENANFIANKIIEKKFSVRQAENYVKIFKLNKKQKLNLKDANISDLENSLTSKIGLNVLIKNNKKNKGSITFYYKEIDQLNKIIELIKSNY